MNLFTQTEISIIISIISGLFLVIFIISIGEIISKWKNSNLQDNNQDEDLELTLKFKQFALKEEEYEDSLLEREEVEVQTSHMEVCEEERETLVLKSEENNTLSDVLEIGVVEDLEVEELIMEFEPLNVVKIEDESLKKLDAKEKAQIELLKIEEELENTRSLEDTITNLEAIEEENAIISYQELLSNTGEMNVVLSDSGDEPITISEVFNMINQEDLKQDVELTKEEIKSVPLSEAYHGDFVKTPYLSPISGIEIENLNEIQLENTANLEKLEKEMRKTNEFLNILNELKKNLE